jgi:hypothetical protein
MMIGIAMCASDDLIEIGDWIRLAIAMHGEHRVVTKDSTGALCDAATTIKCLSPEYIYH